MTSKTTDPTLPARRPAPANSASGRTSAEIAQCRTTCASCKLRDLCVPCCGLSHSERDLAGGLAFTRAHLRRGESLYRNGERFTALYAVRHGCFKSVALIDNGREQVTGFSMTGEVLGMDGIGPERHNCNAIALEESEVCGIPFAGLQALARKIPRLQRNFHNMMSREIERGHGVILQLGSMNAEERLAMFLLDLSQRFAARGCSPAEFHLHMTREEIGSYLGLKLETVSRTFSKFQDEGLIGVQQKFIRIMHSAGLKRVMSRGLR